MTALAFFRRATPYLVTGLAIAATTACTGILGSFTVGQGGPATDGGAQDGGGGLAGLSVDPAIVDFGPMDCGGADGQPITLKVTNTGTSATEWVATLDDPSGVFALSGTTRGALAPNAEASVAVTARAVRADQASAGDVDSALLRIGPASAPDAAAVVQLRRTARGAQFTVVPGEVDFGKLPPSSPKKLPVRLRNTGNAPAAVRVNVPVPSAPLFGVVGVIDTTPVAPGGELNAEIEFKGAAATNTFETSADIEVLAGAKTCKGSTKNVALRAVVSSDPILPSPGILDFGRAPCLGVAERGQQNIELRTGSGTTVSWTASYNGTAFQLDKTSGTIAPNSPVVVQITPKPVPKGMPGPVDEAIDFQVQGTGTTAATVRLRENRAGAYIIASLDQENPIDPNSPLQMPVTPPGSVFQGSLFLANIGNEQPDVQLFVGIGQYFGVSPGRLALPPQDPTTGRFTEVLVSFGPKDAIKYEDTVQIDVTTGVLCSEPIAPPETAKGSTALFMSVTGEGGLDKVPAPPTTAFGTMSRPRSR